MTKHTLGPWYAAYSKTDEFSGGNIRSNHHRDGEGALLFQTGPMFHNYTPDREEELANLRLVAVAPELLEALQEVTWAIDDYCNDWNKPNPTAVTVLLPKLQSLVYRATKEGSMSEEELIANGIIGE